VAYVETVLESALAYGLPRERITALVAGTLAATVDGAARAEEQIRQA
jgi:hypothetical protein